MTACPFLPCKRRMGRGLDDPAGKDDTVCIETIHEIEQKILSLRQEILTGNI